MKRLLGMVVCAGALGLLGPAVQAQGQTAAGGSVTSRVQWSKEAWGELGVGPLKSAPYPDDSRKDGYKTDSETFGYEGHYDDNSVAFVIPQGFKAGASVDFVVICHGHRNQCGRFVGQADLGALLEASGRNAIIIVPQGPKDAPDSGGGKFEKPGGFAAFVNEAFEVLKKEGKLAADAQLGNVVLGGFSGGYRPVALAVKNGQLNEKISEVWLIDAAYGFHEELASLFTDPQSKKAMRSIFTDHLTTENVHIMSLIDQKGARVTVAEDDLLTGSVSAGGAGADPQAAGNAGQELGALVRSERLLFIHTNLPHDAFKMSQRFVGDFLRESPSLKARPTR